MKRVLTLLAVVVIAFIAQSTFAGQLLSKENRRVVIELTFKSEHSRLLPNGDFIDGKYRKKNTEHGKLPRARFEGTNVAGRNLGPETVKLARSFSEEAGQAIRYVLGPQGTGSKARTEHYLHVGKLDSTYCSEFSMMLDPDMTIAEETRLYDGGPNWVILRQWHQSSPESPPIAIKLKSGTNNVIVTSIRFGHHKRKSWTKTMGEKTLKLGKWYHFRYLWHISPGTNESQLKVWVSDKRWGDNLKESDVLFDYHGPIGYTLKGKPESEINSLSYSIREQQGIYQGGHLTKTSIHAVSIANVRIYQIPSPAN